MHGEERATGFSWSRAAFFGMLAVVAFLVVLNGFLMGRQVDEYGSEASVFKQEVVEVGEEFGFGFRLINNRGETVRYTIVVDSNSSDPLYALHNYEKKISLPSGKTYTFSVRFYPSQVERFEVRMSLYEGDEMLLVEDTSFFVEVKEASA